MESINLEIELEVSCSVCGSTLKGTVNHTDPELAILALDPCENCLESKYDKGYSKGYSEGEAKEEL